MASKSTGYQAILAARVRLLRTQAGLRQEDLASLMRDLGFARWSGATVALIENGYRAATYAEVTALAHTLQVTQRDLLRAPATVKVVEVDGGRMTADQWNELLPTTRPMPLEKLRATSVNRDLFAITKLLDAGMPATIIARYGLADRQASRAIADTLRSVVRRVAARLRVSPKEVAAAAYALWDCGLEERRDALVTLSGDDASDRMRKARVTRRLQVEINERIRAARRKR